MMATFGQEQVGRVLGARYRLIAPVGSGASATVYQADDVTLRRRVAVKILHPTLADDPAFIRRFRAEAQAAAALNHPNIMAVYDWGEERGLPFLVCEFLSNGSLRAMLDRGRRLSPSQALLVALEAARGLDYAHRRGFIHRDIKPANLLFGDEGRLRIADFGLARALAEAAWTEPAGVVLGTARYASPEQARGVPLDGRSDVYSLALVVVEAVVGAVPFAAETTVATLMNRIDKLMPVPAELGSLAAVIERAGRPDPEERSSSGELVRALMQTAERLPRPEPLAFVPTLVDVGHDATSIAAPVPTLRPRARRVPTSEPVSVIPEPAVRARRPRRRGRVTAAVIAIVLALGAAAGAVAWSKTNTPSYKVPNLVTLTKAQADNFVFDDGFQVVANEAFDDTAAVGVVIAQSPASGTRLSRGGQLILTVSKGPADRAVPDLTGATLSDVDQRLAVAGLARGHVTTATDETVAKDAVMDWTYKGSSVTKGTLVDLTVSGGPAQRAVPELKGLTLDAAKAKLADPTIHLTAGAVTDAFDTTVPNGQVVSTSPAAGAPVDRDAVVAIVVSKGPDLVAVPNVMNLTLDQAVAKLTANGFAPGSVSGKAGKLVLNTDPRIGQLAPRGSKVDIILG